MATSRPFAINSGATINGTTQVGNVASGTPNNGFAATGLKWYNGPDEELGYIIAGENVTGTAAPDGTTAHVQFWRTADLTDNSFLATANSILNASHSNITNAYNALTIAGYWTSFPQPVATSFGYAFVTGSSYPLSSTGNSTIRIDNPTSLVKYIWLRGNSTYLTSGTNSGAATSPGLTGSPISMSNTITGSSQSFDSGSYILIPANTSNLQFTVANTGVGAMILTYTDSNTPTKTNVPALP